MKKYIPLYLLIIISGCAHAPQVIYRDLTPEVPDNLLSCEPITTPKITTNGDLLMSYITLRSQYNVCSAKVQAIADIISAYKNEELEP